MDSCNKLIILSQEQNLSQLKEFCSDINLEQMSNKITKENRPQSTNNEILGEEIW